ncbi:MAG: hypothetical protein LBL15_05090 [Oscillospiraceae bacterium]|jgi:hypothetical protein|nr:hypothetical protein [Oscillospiraceae bacterium]
MNKNQFDERQLKIRGQVFFHGLISALALVLFNAFLQDDGMIWASPFYQNLLIFMAVVTVVSIDAILRGVYFGQRKRPWLQIGFFGILSVVLTGFCLRDLLQGAALTENAGLTGKGASLVFDSMFVAITLIGAIKALAEKHKNDAQQEMLEE